MKASRTALKRALRAGGVSTGLIKGDASSTPDEGLVPGFSASGQDVWLPSATHFGPGLVLSAVGARCGKVFQADGSWSVVANTVVLAPQPGHHPRYLWYLVNDEEFWEKGGTAQPYVRVPETLARKVWLPSLETQRAIADYLDTETARIDALIAKKQRMIDILREQFASAVEQAAPHGRYRDARLRWCTRRIADGTHGTYQRQTSGYPLLSAKNLRDGRVVVGDDESYVSESDYHEVSGTCGFQPGDVLFGVIGGSIGNVARLTADDPTAFQRSVAAVSPSELLHADFLYLISMGRSFQDKLKLAANSSAQSGVYLGALGDISIPLPSIADQALIVAWLNRLLRWQDSLKASLSRQIELLLERRQALITAAVTGEFEVPGVAA